MKRLRYVFTGAGALAVSAVVAKLLGALYRIPLTNIVGSEGMGLYQMVFPFYTLLLTVSSGGLPVAISRLVAVKLSNNDERGASNVLRISVCVLSVVGFLGSLLMFALGKTLATFQGNSSAGLAYQGISPAVFLVSILSCFRGYYQGRENMLPTAFSQLIEQAVKLVAGLYFASRLMSKGVEYGVLGAIFGVALSEVIATLTLGLWYAFTHIRLKKNLLEQRTRELSMSVSEEHYFAKANDDLKVREGKRRRYVRIKYLRENNRIRENERKQNKNLYAQELATDMTASAGFTAVSSGLQDSCRRCGLKDENSVIGIIASIVKVALPVTFGALVLPITQVIDSVLIINVLSKVGFTASGATGTYGLLSGTVTTLINMPTVVIYAFSVSLLPKIAKACNEVENVRKEAELAFRICVALGLLLSVFMVVYANPLVEVLYSRGLSESKRRLCASLLRTSGISVFFVSVVQVSTAVLQGVDKAKKPAINLLVGAVVKIILTATFLPLFGIYGAVIGSVSCYAVSAIMDLLSVRKEIGRIITRSKTIPILIISALAEGIIGIVSVLIFDSIKILSLCALIGFLSAIGVLLGFGWFNKGEKQRIFPFFK